MTEVRVIGAGLSGLATAWYLAEAGARVHVFEASGRAGGLIQTLRCPEGLVETAAPAFTSSGRVQALFAAASVEPVSPRRAAAKRYIFREGRPRRWPLTPLETSAALLRFSAAWISGRHRPDPDESLDRWGKRVIGRSALEWLLAPAAQIYAAPPDALSAAAVLNGRRRRTTRVAPRGGMQELLDRLVERLHGRGVRFSFDERIAALDPSVPTAICTCAPSAARLLAAHAPRVAAALESIRTASLVTATAFFEPSPRDLRGFGVLFPRSSNVGALGVLFNSDIFPGRSHLRSETWIYADRPAGTGVSPVAAGSSGSEGPSPIEAGFSGPEDDARRQLAADRAVLTGRDEDPIAVYTTARPDALPIYDAAVVRAAAMLDELPPAFALAGNYLGALGVSRLVDGGAAAAARLLRVDGGKS